MRDTLQKRHGVSLIIVKNQEQGLVNAKALLYKNVDSKTALFLSGGVTPKHLYQNLALEKKLHPGAVAFVDERYGLPLHENSNERMMKETGLLEYFEKRNIPFYSILSGSYCHPEFISGFPRVSKEMPKLVRHDSLFMRQLEGVSITAKEYDKKAEEIFSRFPKSVAILGIGEDGHTAGLRPRYQKSKIKNQKYVIGITDFQGEFKERITLTFKALSKMDLLIVLVFGEKKRHALELMFTDGSISEVPARFYVRPDIARKTVVITDQKI